MQLIVRINDSMTVPIEIAGREKIEEAIQRALEARGVECELTHIVLLPIMTATMDEHGLGTATFGETWNAELITDGTSGVEKILHPLYDELMYDSRRRR